MSPSATQDRYPYQDEPTWSTLEMVIALRAFGAALSRELQDLMQKAKQIANQIEEAVEVWQLERSMTRRRKEHRLT